MSRNMKVFVVWTVGVEGEGEIDESVAVPEWVKEEAAKAQPGEKKP